MSNYTDASLIYYPSGYKAGTAYSLKPTDGSGDLTFTRSSTATRVNEQGLIEGVRTNLMLYSEEFDNGSWNKSNSSVTANTTTSPNGTTNADSLIEDTSNNLHQLYQSTTATGGIYTASIYAKANGRNWFALNIAAAGSYSAFFDIQNGVVGTIQANITSASITSVGNGWYRCSVTANTGALSPRISLTMSTANNVFSYTGDGTSGIYIWGAQLESGDIATEYIPTTTTAVSVGMLANVPRIDYTGGGCGKLLLEPQRTNLALYSQDFTQSVWAKLVSGSGSTIPVVTANYAISPDGTQNAARFQCTLGSSGYSMIEQSILASGTHTGSVWVKSNTGANQNIYFRIGPANTFVVTPEWQRITITESTGSYLTIGLRDLTGYTNYSCDILIYGAQLELGSYATSYIPTTTTAVTRVAETSLATSIDSLFGSNNTFYSEFIYHTSSTSTFLEVNQNGGSANLLQINATNSNKINYTIFANGAFVASRSTNEVLTDGVMKVALKYDGINYKVFLNGSLIDTYAQTSIPVSLNRIYCGNARGTQQFGKGIRQTLLFPTALSDAELIALTTL